MDRPVDVLVLSTSRADSGPLQPVIDELARRTDLTCGVTHVSGSQVAIPAGLTDLRLDVDLPAETPRDAVRSGRRLAAALEQVLAKTQPRMVIVLGDRWVLLFAVPVALLHTIPVMHLHGGEVSEGALDERVRHAVTKLSDFHCAATEGAAARIRQLGEPFDRVWVTGAPGLDRLAGVQPLTQAEWSHLLNGPVIGPVGLITYHPATSSSEDPVETASNILDSCGRILGTVVVSHPGDDPRAGEIVRLIETFASDHPNVFVVPHLGSLFPRALASCDVLVGNSSSGIIEAASFHTPVVNIGVRQQGRESGANVIHCGTGPDQIDASIRRALSASFATTSGLGDNPYGDGHASQRIVEAVRQALAVPAGLKHFVDQPGGDRVQR